jgi:hypothetical protein
MKKDDIKGNEKSFEGERINLIASNDLINDIFKFMLIK